MTVAAGSGDDGKMSSLEHSPPSAPSAAAEALAKLDYDPRYLEYGVLDIPSLMLQSEEFDASDDSNTEHYRHGTLARFFHELETIDPEQFERLLTLDVAESTTALRHDILHKLIRVPGLTQKQFDRVADLLTEDGAHRVVLRLRLLRLHRAAPSDPQVVDRCLREGDGTVHEALLDSSDASRATIEKLSEAGATKRVRNLAAERLAKRGRS
jgi:hypothetical protein